jgi:hypothetical protein
MIHKLTCQPIYMVKLGHQERDTTQFQAVIPAIPLHRMYSLAVVEHFSGSIEVYIAMISPRDAPRD